MTDNGDSALCLNCVDGVFNVESERVDQNLGATVVGWLDMYWITCENLLLGGCDDGRDVITVAERPG